MSIHQYPITMPIRNAVRARPAQRPLRLKRSRPLSATAREVLFAYAMTGSAAASLAIIAAPHLEVLLRCIFHGRG